MKKGLFLAQSVNHKYPRKYETIKDIAEAINIPYGTIKVAWIPKASRLSNLVKEKVKRDLLTERAAYSLLKYPRSVQDKLAKAINIPYQTVLSWTNASNRLSDSVKKYVRAHTLTERAAKYLLKYPHSVQDKKCFAMATCERPSKKRLLRTTLNRNHHRERIRQRPLTRSSRLWTV